MKMFLYTVYDRCAGVYNEPFMAVNENTAIRRFNYMMMNSPMIKEDCDLYLIGEFDTKTANIEVKCDFIARYEEVKDE